MRVRSVACSSSFRATHCSWLRGPGPIGTPSRSRFDSAADERRALAQSVRERDTALATKGVSSLALSIGLVPADAVVGRGGVQAQRNGLTTCPSGHRTRGRTVSVARSGFRLHRIARPLAHQRSAAGAQKTVCATNRTAARAENTVHASERRIDGPQNGVGAPERGVSRRERSLSRANRCTAAPKNRVGATQRTVPRVEGVRLRAPAGVLCAREPNRSVAARRGSGEEGRLPSRAAFRCIE
jgi:hypothetical protein